MSDQLINVGIVIDPSGAVSGVSVGEQMFNRVGEAADKMNDKIDRSEQLWTRMRSAALAYLSVAAVRTFLQGMTSEFMQAEQAGARFDAVLRATGNTAKITRGSIDDLANEIANSTLFSDDEVINATARMMTYRSVQGETFTEGIRLAADLAAMLGMDLESAVRMLGRALESPVDGMQALRRAGVVLSDQTKDNIQQLVSVGRTADAQKVILDELQKRVGGVAQAMNTGLTKAVEGAGKAWREFLENMGKTEHNNVGALELFFTGLQHVLKEMTPNTDALHVATENFMEAAEDLDEANDHLADLLANHPEAVGNIDFWTKVRDRAKAEVDALNAQITELRRQRDTPAGFDPQNSLSWMRPPASVAPTQDPETAKRIDELTAAAKRQGDVIGMTNAQIARHDALLVGATQTQADHIAALVRGADVTQVFADAYEALNTGVETNTEDLWRQAVAAGATEREMSDLLDVLDQIATASEEARVAGEALRKSAPPKPAAPQPQQDVMEWRMNEETGRMEHGVRRSALPQAMQNTMAEQEWWDKVKRQAQTAGEESSAFWQKAWERAAENTQDILSNSIETTTTEGELRFSRFMENILRMINRIAAQMASAGLIKLFIQAADGLPGAPDVPTAGDVSTALKDVPERSVPAGNVAPIGSVTGAGITGESSAPVVVHQSITFQISAIDHQDMEQALRRQKGTIAAVVAEAAQQSTGFASQLAGRKR